MINLPDFETPFDYENGFYLTCDSGRIGKFLAHYELFKITQEISGAIVECGVFKGASFSRFAMFRKLLCGDKKKKLVGFDMFGPFPDTDFQEDKEHRDKFVQSAGLESIGVDQLKGVLAFKSCQENLELIEGNICKTIPDYVRTNPDFEISLLNLDTDVYEPAVTILENLYPRLKPGGVLILDDYNVFPGETKAVNEYFAGQKIEIKKFDFAATPCYIIKP